MKMIIHKSKNNGWGRTMCGLKFFEQMKGNKRVVFDLWGKVTCKNCLRFRK